MTTTRRQDRYAPSPAPSRVPAPADLAPLDAYLAARPLTRRVGHTIVRGADEVELDAAEIAEKARQSAQEPFPRSAKEKAASAGSKAANRRRAALLAAQRVG